jgi:DNA invertase Pin-like site-specific DNA recombinase
VRRVGYVRGKDLNWQLAVLAAADCDTVVSEHAGPREERVELDRLLAGLDESDTLVIVRLSVIALNVRQLLKLGNTMESRGIRLVVTGTDVDRLVLDAGPQLAVLVEIEACLRELIGEGTRDGLAVGRTQGRRGGRRPKLGAGELARAQARFEDKDRIETVEQIAQDCGVSRSTLYRRLRRAQANAADVSASEPKESVGA